ncbi:MAG: ABC transporter substrate-binding protein [Pseudomonadota bacterium]
MQITNRFKSRINTAIAAGLVIAGATAGTVFAADPGVTDTEIVIGLHAPLSGPLVAFGQDPLQAAKMWYDETNKKGGIHGRKIRVIAEDDKCNATEVGTLARKFVTVDKVFLINGGSCTASVVGAQEFVNREKVPFVMLNASGDPAVFPPTRYVFGAFPGSQGAIGAAIMGFSIDFLKGKRIAYIAHNDEYGGSNYGAAKALADKKGIQIVAYERIAPGITDVTAPILNVRAANPDVIISAAYPGPAVLIAQKLAEYGMKQPVVQAVQGIPAPEVFAKNVGNNEALKNFYYSAPLNDLANGPKQAKWVDMYKKAYPDRTIPSAFMAYGIASAMAVTAALEKVGKDLTREKFVDAMENLKLDSGVMAAPFEFGKGRRDAFRAQSIFKFDGAKSTLMPGVYTWDGSTAGK